MILKWDSYVIDLQCSSLKNNLNKQQIHGTASKAGINLDLLFSQVDNNFTQSLLTDPNFLPSSSRVRRSRRLRQEHGLDWTDAGDRPKGQTVHQVRLLHAPWPNHLYVFLLA